MQIKVGISNRHIHLNESDYKELFGDQKLTKRNDLTQKGQFAANETVTIKTLKNEIKNVRIVGPLRDYTQVEISKTDSYTLGITPPIRDSGDLSEASEITIINNDKKITRNACIIPTRHIHINRKEQEKYGLYENCKIKINNEKSTILEDVHIKVDDSYTLELHLDTDDGNASLLKSGDEVEIIKDFI